MWWSTVSDEKKQRLIEMSEQKFNNAAHDPLLDCWAAGCLLGPRDDNAAAA